MIITDESNEGPEFRKIEEVANLFRISRSTAFRLMKEQGWPRHKFGTELRFSKEDVEAIRAMNRKVPLGPKVTPKVGTRANRRSKPKPDGPGYESAESPQEGR